MYKEIKTIMSLFFFTVFGLFFAVVCSGCATATGAVDMGDAAISQELNSQLSERNKRLEAGIDRIADISERAEAYAREAGTSLDQLEVLLRVYFRAVADIRKEIDDLKREAQNSN